MKKMKINWKVKFAIILIIAAILMYAFAFVFLNEPDKVFFYIVIDCAFIPIDVLIVVLVIESVIEKKEKKAVLDKLDMILGLFFSEIGNNLLEIISNVNAENDEIIKSLKDIDKWSEKDFEKAYKYIDDYGVIFKPDIHPSEVPDFILTIKRIITGKRGFLIDLIENPNILEKDSLSNLLLAIFHLNDELALRTDIEKINSKDLNHLINDINRIYSRLTYEWIKYLEYLNENYPYMSSLALRTNPFNPEIDVYITD